MSPGPIFARSPSLKVTSIIPKGGYPTIPILAAASFLFTIETFAAVSIFRTASCIVDSKTYRNLRPDFLKLDAAEIKPQGDTISEGLVTAQSKKVTWGSSLERKFIISSLAQLQKRMTSRSTFSFLTCSEITLTFFVFTTTSCVISINRTADL